MLLAKSLAGAAALAAGLAISGHALADGSETLGPPSIGIAQGTDYVMWGVGLLDGQPDDIEIEIPAGVAVVQAILYWEGHDLVEGDSVATDTIMFNGSSVTGTRIGGPTHIYSNGWTSTYRVDVTTEAALGDGLNVLPVSGLTFTRVNNGAGLLVVIDDGTSMTVQDVRDGNDYAFNEAVNGPPIGVTVPQTFLFEPCTYDRIAHVGAFISSVALEDPSGNFGRPSVIRFAIDGSVVEELVDTLANNNGPEWDTLDHFIAIPAGATSLTVSLHSIDAGGVYTGHLPASMVWNAATFSLVDCDEEPPGGGEGCTPGYWRQKQHFDSYPAPYAWDTLFADVFEDAFPGKNFAQVVAGRAGGSNMLRQLGRHTVAALLNAASADVNYDLTPDEVISMFNSVYPGSSQDYEDLKDVFADFNEQGCLLN